MNMAKTILITGAGGFIGSATAIAFIEKGLRVIVIGHTGSNLNITGAENRIGDILDKAFLDDLFSEFNIDVVYHFASKKNVGQSTKEPILYYETNVVGTLNILEMMAKYNVPHIVFASSWAVYAPASSGALFCSEDFPLNPQTVYGNTKMIGEKLISDFAATYLIETYHILRYSNIAGGAGLKKSPTAFGVFDYVADSALNDKPFNIFGNDYPTPDGTCVRDYVSLNDIVRLHVELVSNNISGAYNIGSGKGASIEEIVTSFEDELSKKIERRYHERRLGDPHSVILDVSSAKQNLGWSAKDDIREMVIQTIKNMHN